MRILSMFGFFAVVIRIYKLCNHLVMSARVSRNAGSYLVTPLQYFRKSLYYIM